MTADEHELLNQAYTAQLHLEMARRHALSRSYLDSIRNVCANVARGMNQADYASSDIPDLLKRYVDSAKRDGGGRRYFDIAKAVHARAKPEPAKAEASEVERKRNLLTMLNVGEALRARRRFARQRAV